jgi:Tfp pilus assembly protein PilN
MIEINLIPDVKQELIRARMVRSAVVSGAIITTIIAAAVVAVLSVYVFGIQTVRSAVADDAIKKGSAQLASVEDLSKILTIQNQLTKVNDLNNNKAIDSRVFELLQAIIPPAPNDVKVSSLIVDASAKTITFEGQTPTYPALEAFKKTIGAANVRYMDDSKAQQDVPLASSLSISNISYGEDSTGKKVLRFTVSFTYADELFSPKVVNPTIVLINGGNVTDSYLGIPKSIFTDRASDTNTGGN